MAFIFILCIDKVPNNLLLQAGTYIHINHNKHINILNNFVFLPIFFPKGVEQTYLKSPTTICERKRSISHQRAMSIYGMFLLFILL